MQTRIEEKPSTTKRMIVMILAVLGLVAVIAGIKVLSIMRMIAASKPPPPAVVSTAKAAYQDWQPELRAVGTLRAVRGADLALDVAKKQLRAPFAGRAGIVTINPGAYLSSGTMIVTLQQLDPIYVDFHLPQKDLAELRTGQKVALRLDAFPGRTFEGTLSAISPKVDSDTRNVQVEAKVPNPDRVLTPGMFANVSVDVGAKQRYLTLPQTAVVYNPYGETVFVVMTRREADRRQAAAAAAAAAAADDPPREQQPKKPGKGPQLPPDELVVQQAFVTTGPRRGDQVAILKGLEEGVEVITSGQIKLKSGSPIRIDNSVQPANSPNPTPQEH